MLAAPRSIAIVAIILSPTASDRVEHDASGDVRWRHPPACCSRRS